MALSLYSQEANKATVARLQRVMTQFNLKKSEVAYLLGFTGGAGRQRVHKWFTHQRRCPDDAPETIRAIMAIRDPEDIKQELREAKRTKSN